jgi:DNA mismatch endonuclease (patch repair protein)
MSRIPQRDTKPEMRVRRLLHSLGYRYRLHRRDLPGKPDLVFGPRRKVIFVHGCFWHRHSGGTCGSGGSPKSNSEYWTKKFDRNVARDAANIQKLVALGWRVHVVWECETKTVTALAPRLTAFLESE